MFYFLLLFSWLACLCSASEPVCVLETSLGLSRVHLVSEHHLQQRSVAGCVVHCLSRPGVASVMVSYSPGVLGILGDQFNCICGQEAALDNTVTVDPALCDGSCPAGEGELACGDSRVDLVSVYSLYTNLTSHSQGCLTAQAVQWSSVTTLHDFEGLTLQDCQARCDTMEGPGFSISRLIDDRQSSQATPVQALWKLPAMQLRTAGINRNGCNIRSISLLHYKQSEK